jgi:Protein of unknown function (DUF3551)
VFLSTTNKRCVFFDWGISVTTTRLAIILAIALAALATGLCVQLPGSRAAAGDEPWCIIDDEGNSHCNYPTSQECLQAIASGAGSRGFCNVNSSPAPASAAQPVKRRAQH